MSKTRRPSIKRRQRRRLAIPLRILSFFCCVYNCCSAVCVVVQILSVEMKFAPAAALVTLTLILQSTEAGAHADDDGACDDVAAVRCWNRTTVGVVRDEVRPTAHATSSAVSRRGGVTSAAAMAASGPSSTYVSNAVSSAVGRRARTDTKSYAEAFYGSSTEADSEASVEGEHSAAIIRSDALATHSSVAASSSKGTIEGDRSIVDVQRASEATKYSTALATGEAHVYGNDRNAMAGVYALAEDSGFSEASDVANNNKEGLYEDHRDVVYGHGIEDDDDDLYHTSPALTSKRSNRSNLRINYNLRLIQFDLIVLSCYLQIRHAIIHRRLSAFILEQVACRSSTRCCYNESRCNAIKDVDTQIPSPRHFKDKSVQNRHEDDVTCCNGLKH